MLKSFRMIDRSTVDGAENRPTAHALHFDTIFCIPVIQIRFENARKSDVSRSAARSAPENKSVVESKK